METILPEKQSLRILFLASDPGDEARLQLGAELQAVRNKLTGNPYFEIKDHLAVKPDDVLQTITSYKPHIVHFSGHGKSTGELCFQDESGKSKTIPPEALASLFSLVLDYVKCVIVNTCYSEQQASAIAQFIPVVIGTKKDISDSAAIKFSMGFYTSLEPDLSQNSLKKAFERGKIAIQFDGNLQEHLIPILIEGSPEVRFASEVDSAFSAISQPKEIAVQILIKGLTLTGKKMGLTEETVRRIIDEKIKRLQDYNESITEYENCMKDILRDEFPPSESSLAALLQLQNGLGLKNEDVNRIKNKIMSDPKLDSPYSWYDRGRGQFDLKKFDKAVEYYSKAIEKNPEYSGAYYERGYCYQTIQEYPEAIADLDKAIEYNKNWEIDSNLATAYLTRGYIYYSMQPQTVENVSKALADWTMSIKLNPNDYVAHMNRGLANQFLRNFEKAITDYKKSLDLDTRSPYKEKLKRVSNIIRCYSELGDSEGIEKWKQYSIELLGMKTEVPVAAEEEKNGVEL